MKSMTFKQFMSGRRRTPGNMYILKNKTEVLYVGISSWGIWDRWFGARGRMYQTPHGEWFGTDHVGREIIKRFPESLHYTIDLLTLEEAIELGRDETLYRGLNLDKVDIKMAEMFVIQKLRPKFNIIHNPAPISTLQQPPQERFNNQRSNLVVKRQK